MKVMKMTIGGGNPLFAETNNCLEMLGYELSDIEKDDPVTVEFEVVEMTQEEIEALPEWDGP